MENCSPNSRLIFLLTKRIMKLGLRLDTKTHGYFSLQRAVQSPTKPREYRGASSKLTLRGNTETCFRGRNLPWCRTWATSFYHISLKSIIQHHLISRKSGTLSLRLLLSCFLMLMFLILRSVPFAIGVVCSNNGKVVDKEHENAYSKGENAHLCT